MIGGLIALIVSILPAFIVIIIYTVLYNHKADNKRIDYVFDILRPIIIGIILSSGVELLIKSVFVNDIITNIKNMFNFVIKENLNIYKNIFVWIILFLILYMYKRITNRKLNTIIYIVISSLIDDVIYNGN